MADEEQGDSHEAKAVKQEGQIINLVVKDQSGNEVHFKVKGHTKLEKVRHTARGGGGSRPHPRPGGEATCCWQHGVSRTRCHVVQAWHAGGSSCRLSPRPCGSRHNSFFHPERAGRMHHAPCRLQCMHAWGPWPGWLVQHAHGMCMAVRACRLSPPTAQRRASKRHQCASCSTVRRPPPPSHPPPAMPPAAAAPPALG